MIGVDPRVSGAQRYSVDVERPGMLHAAFVRSPHAHARVLAVDASALPGDCVALLPEDVADLGPLRLPGARPARARRRRAPRRRRRRRGRGADRAAARAAAAPASTSSYEELPAVFDAVEAVAPGAPLLHPDAAESAGEAVSIGVRPLAGTNVCHRFRIRHGDVAAGLRATPTWSSRRRSARRAPRTRRWSRTPRSPSGRTGG